MVIQKVINNNVISAYDVNQQESDNKDDRIDHNSTSCSLLIHCLLLHLGLSFYINSLISTVQSLRYMEGSCTSVHNQVHILLQNDPES